MSAAKFTTASQLFASAHGESCDGPRQCFYCGVACDERFDATQYVKDTFTDWAIVVCPQNGFICAGCLLSMREKADMPGRDKPQKIRNYSWVIEATKATSFSKAETGALREWCLSPPEPPFAIIVATSGQKHLVFRAPACHSREIVTVQLEAERVTYRPRRVGARILRRRDSSS